MGKEQHEHREGPIQPDSGGLISPGDGQALQRAGLAMGAALAVVALGVLFYLGMANSFQSTMHVSGDDGPNSMQTYHSADPPPLQQAKQPASAEKPQETQPASQQPSVATRVPGLDSGYLSTVYRDIQTSWQQSEDRHGLKADAPVYVAFTLHRSGDIRSIWLFKSSGNEALDALALESVQDVGAFNRFPRSMPQKEQEMLFIFTPDTVTMASWDERGKPIYPR